MKPPDVLPEELDACHRCGGKAELIKSVHDDDNKCPREFVFGKIECFDCGLQTPEDELSEMQSKIVLPEKLARLYRSWNKRVRKDLHAALKSENEKLERALDQILDDLSQGTMVFPGKYVCEYAWNQAIKALPKQTEE